MEQREIRELAEILVAEHGCRAAEVAARRRAQHADRPRSEIYQLWDAIAAAARRMLRRRARREQTG